MKDPLDVLTDGDQEEILRRIKMVDIKKKTVKVDHEKEYHAAIRTAGAFFVMTLGFGFMAVYFNNIFLGVAAGYTAKCLVQEVSWFRRLVMMAHRAVDQMKKGED